MASSSGHVGGFGLLIGNRTRSYGSLMQSPCSPVRQRRIEHQVEVGDTLPGLALKYGVTIEQIKRANRLYTNDSIFLKKTLHIPILTDPKQLDNGKSHDEETVEGLEGTDSAAQADEGRTDPSGNQSKEATHPQDMSATDFLQNLDSKIRMSKSAAVKKLKEGDILGIGEAECSSRCSSRSPRANHAASAHAQQRSLLGPVPLTRTTLAATLKDREDEIFKL
ncbi:lysM and putative peptidoglycan-binding domain-containing protein 1 [Ambystoma mexicanum]|uniref:lysM and putative peptidoglycan-binding domain-containing protein 1 n=1 Tax=Ambystoma mexicanum TaxID=8296 RepID=UPI0037E7EEBD